MSVANLRKNTMLNGLCAKRSFRATYVNKSVTSVSRRPRQALNEPVSHWIQTCRLLLHNTTNYDRRQTHCRSHQVSPVWIQLNFSPIPSESLFLFATVNPCAGKFVDSGTNVAHGIPQLTRLTVQALRKPDIIWNLLPKIQLSLHILHTLYKTIDAHPCPCQFTIQYNGHLDNV